MKADLFDTGLKNEVGEYNCFLNVIVQACCVDLSCENSIFMAYTTILGEFFLRRSTAEHVHVRDHCTSLIMSSTDARREAVAPTSLRITLGNLYRIVIFSRRFR